jgi:hypothetical protein
MADKVLVSNKARKRANEKGFLKRFEPPKDERTWNPDVCVLEGTFWSSCGIPQPTAQPMATSMQELARVEAERAAAVDALRKGLIREAGPLYPSMAFERWCMSAKEAERLAKGPGPFDPLIPTCSVHHVDPVLAADLEGAGVPKPRVVEICLTLHRHAAIAAEKLRNFSGAANVSVAFRGDEAILMLKGPRHESAVSLSQKSLEKLQTLAARFRDAGASTSPDSDPKAKRRKTSNDSAFDLNLQIFTMARRYETLGAAGYQAALPGAAFEALRAKFGVSFECFASPLNSYYERYCSAFPDTDRAFGSVGSFFEFRPRCGSFEANPPFTPALIHATIAHIEQLLGHSEQSERGPNEAVGAGALSFAMVSPVWEDTEGWALLSGSRFLRGAVRVAKEEHAWRDCAKGRHAARRVPCDTQIFFLQNFRGAETWPCSEAALSALRSSLVVAAPVSETSRVADGPSTN